MSNSRDESSRQDAPSNTDPTAPPLSDVVSQLEAEVDRINRFFDGLVAGSVHEVSFALYLRGQARARSSRRAADGIVPEEIIDFSVWGPVPEVPLHRGSGRYLTPDAIIDLSEPQEEPRSNSRHRRRRLADEIFADDAPEASRSRSRSRSRSSHRRRRRHDEPNAEEVIDVDEVEPPPKRARKEDEEEEEEPEPEPGCYKCPVCLGCARGHEPVATKCGHIFCRDCLELSLQKAKRCPICFTRLTRRQYMRIYI
ncbi:hypothetical protein KR067_005993 [Drosophila pandora]|nr:hypothetical protein KR067_005993 [Drosophila pandora]